MQVLVRARQSVVAATMTLALIIGSSALLGSTPTAASELPNDDQLKVAERSHVDSPKVYFDEADGLKLNAQFGGATHPIEQTINYAERAYDRNGRQQYYFQANKDAPELDFLRETGEHWYMTPAVNPLGMAQIWSGFGADTGIPVEKFRDATFSLDLVSVNGPGRVELLVWNDREEGELGHVNRMLSSTDPNYRSFALTPGNHTHNLTLFSAPGRYELTYRATARGKDGKLIASKDSVLQWQVGGNRPGTPMDSDQPKTKSAEKFSVTPVADSHDDAVPLHQLRVALGEPVSGTAEFTVNGFHLATVKLRDGEASFTELLGGTTADYQVTVRDESGKVRYTSAPLAVTPGQSAATSDAGGASPKSPAASPALSANEISLKEDITAKVTVSSIEGDARRIDIEFSKPGFVGFVDLSNHPEPGSKYSDMTSSINATGEQHISFVASYDSYSDGYQLKATLRPHPVVRNAEMSEVTLTDSYEPGKPVSASTTARATSSTDPQPSEPAEPEPSDPQPGEPNTQRVILGNGHLDLAATPTDNGGIDLLVRDDTREHAPDTIDRQVDDVALAVPDYLMHERKGETAGSDWDAVLAPAPKRTHVLPHTQREGAPWPGYSSDRFNYQEITGPVSLELVAVKGPGRLAVFQPNSLGGAPQIVLGSASGTPKRIDMDYPTHAHAGWAFTEPGSYELTFRSTVKKSDGSTATSPTHTLLVLVGNAAIDDYKAGSEAAPETDGPSATPANPATGDSATERAGAEAPSTVGSTTKPIGAETPSTGDSTTEPIGAEAPSVPSAVEHEAAAGPLAKTGAPVPVLPLGLAAIALLLGGALAARRTEHLN
ncbi:choice-of-anchor M domain-containing protein [Pseudoglutamicibacter cumminsii]|uniref:choice-of-anchor M domain-containing protein n=1 Tax=Pseudoglutamicibacter cumminsii TaxID=156979 RepID=UPI0025547031|nr:choice-of-anchor M domain-containing protein [Pseudoglutamicibacter cumminsii]MDK7083164.1 choice-of-anchor M domain-containing protein [Pseudoglutamicibacter cumminsii]